MRLIIFIELIYMLTINGQPCVDDNSVDLTDAEVFHDGTISKYGIKFPPKHVYSKNVSGEFKTFGCVCEFKKCIRKCCPLGQVLHRSVLGRKCIDGYDAIQEHGLNLSFYNSFKKTVKFNDMNEYNLFQALPCEGDVYVEDMAWFVQEDGNLYIEVPSSIPPWMLRGPDQYCVDTFIFDDGRNNVTHSFDALVCFATDKDKNNYLISSSCMLVSCVFIIATLAVYGWLPELRNLHGRVLMAYLVCLFVGFICMATMQIQLQMDNIKSNTCVTLTIIIYFSLLAAFFWLNVMCFDIWWTFSGKRGITIEKMTTRAKFYAYSVYAFGFPTVLTIIMVSLEFSGLKPHPLLPLLRYQGCFLSQYSKLLYLYGPIVILWFANIVFFALTAIKIAKIRKEISVLKSRDSAKHDGQNKERQRFWLYIKLFVVMGISWVLEVISALYPSADNFFRFTDAYNVLIGVFVFIIFVCKRKIFRLIKKRYKQMRGDSLTKSQFSTRTTSTRDDIALTSTARNQ